MLLLRVATPGPRGIFVKEQKTNSPLGKKLSAKAVLCSNLLHLYTKNTAVFYLPKKKTKNMH